MHILLAVLGGVVLGVVGTLLLKNYLAKEAAKAAVAVALEATSLSKKV